MAPKNLLPGLGSNSTSPRSRVTVLAVISCFFVFQLTKCQELNLPEWLQSRILSNCGLTRVKHERKDVRIAKSGTLLVLKIDLPQSVGQTRYYADIRVEQTISEVCVQAYSRQLPCKCHSHTHFVLHKFCFTKMWRHKFLCNGKAIHIRVNLQEWPLVAKHQKTKQWH